MQITDLPNEIILHIESYINNIVLLEDLIFVNKYFRQIFMSRLNSKTLNYFNISYNSYIYYPSIIKEKIFQYEDDKYKACYCEYVKYDGIQIGFIEKYKANNEELYWPGIDYNDKVAIRPYWRCWCYISLNRYNLKTLNDMQFGLKTKIDVRVYRIYPRLKQHIAEWSNKATKLNHLTQYFTKEMAIEQVIYHYKQLSK